MTSYYQIHNYKEFGKLCKKCIYLNPTHITCKKRIVQGRENKCKYFQISAFACGHCGTCDRENTRKIVFHGHGNILCYSCEAEMNDCLENIAKKYLCSVK